MLQGARARTVAALETGLNLAHYALRGRDPMTDTLRCCAVVLALLGVGNAQGAPAQVAGARVRVMVPKHICSSTETWPCYRHVIGTLVSIDHANIGVRPESGETESVSRAPTTRLDLSAGPGACGVRCIALGFIGGAAVGGLVYAVSGGAKSNCVTWGCLNPYALAVPAGAVLGMIIGAVLRVEQWESAPLLARLRLGPDGAGRVGLGLSLPF